MDTYVHLMIKIIGISLYLVELIEIKDNLQCDFSKNFHKNIK